MNHGDSPFGPLEGLSPLLRTVSLSQRLFDLGNRFSQFEELPCKNVPLLGHSRKLDLRLSQFAGDPDLILIERYFESVAMRRPPLIDGAFVLKIEIDSIS